MSNNDLWCSKCKSHHHPVECPLDEKPKEHLDAENIDYHTLEILKPHMKKDAETNIACGTARLLQNKIKNLILRYGKQERERGFREGKADGEITERLSNI